MTGARHRRAAVAVGLAAGALLLAPPASAAITEGPAADEVVGTYGARTITATFPTGGSALEVLDPADQVVLRDTDAVVGEGTLSVVLSPACPAEPADGCAPTAPAPNGRWLIRQTGSAQEERAFFLRIGGTPPTEVKAALAERTATVTWKKGPEPDVTGFTVTDGAGRSVSVESGACAEDGTCRTTMDYPAPASGSRTFSVRALRPSGVQDQPDVAGAPASSEPVALPAPTAGPTTGPTADPTAGPTAGATGSPGPAPGGPTGTPGATGSPSAAAGGTGQATAQSFGQGFSSFAPSLGLPKVPPLPATTAPQVAGPQVADTFEPELGYSDEEREPGEPEPIAAPNGRETVLQSTGGLLGDEQLLRSVAGALVLLLSAGHLRTWLARSRPDDLA